MTATRLSSALPKSTAPDRSHPSPSFAGHQHRHICLLTTYFPASLNKINGTVLATLRGVLAKTCTGDAVAGIECKALLAHTFGLCPRGLDPHGLCSCLRRFRAFGQRLLACRRTYWAPCCAKTVDCRLCMGHLRVLLEKTRWIIEDSIDTWADTGIYARQSIETDRADTEKTKTN